MRLPLGKKHYTKPARGRDTVFLPSLRRADHIRSRQHAFAAVFGPFVLSDTAGRYRGNVFVFLKESRCFVAAATYRVIEQPTNGFDLQNGECNCEHKTLDRGPGLLSGVLRRGVRGGPFHRKDACCTTAVPPCGCKTTAAAPPCGSTAPGAIPAGAIPLQARPIPARPLDSNRTRASTHSESGASVAFVLQGRTAAARPFVPFAAARKVSLPAFNNPLFRLRRLLSVTDCAAYSLTETCGIARMSLGPAFHPQAKRADGGPSPASRQVVRSSLADGALRPWIAAHPWKKEFHPCVLAPLGTLIALCAGLLSSGCCWEHRCCHRPPPAPPAAAPVAASPAVTPPTEGSWPPPSGLLTGTHARSAHADGSH